MLAISLGWRRDGRSWIDVGLYAEWARAVFTGDVPGHPLDEYPPLARLVLLLFGWTPSSVFYAATFIAAMAAVDLLFLRVVLNASRANHGSDIAVLLWIVAPALLGGLLWTRFDLLPAVAAACALGTRPSSARRGAWLGIAAALKLWPIVLLPSILILGRRPRRALGAVIVCSLLGVVLPALVVPGDTWGAVTWTLDRGLHIESLAGSLFALSALLGNDVSSEFTFGAYQVTAHGTGAAAVLSGLLGIGVGIAVVASLRGLAATDRDQRARVAGLALVTAMLLSSKVLSPQYLVWIVAPAAMVLATVTTRRPRWIAGLIVVTCAMTHLVYPLLYTELVEFRPVGVAALLVRNGLLLGLAVVLLLELRPRVSRTGPSAAHEGAHRPPAMSIAPPPSSDRVSPVATRVRRR